MKMQVFNIDLSEFTEGKSINDIELCDYSLSDKPYAIFVGYYPNLEKLLVIKSTTTSLQETCDQGILAGIDCAIFYPLN
jgi:hypothetical protein